jgi:aspartyl-tRNA(Asn)/glutamyl-tRNA(Gln) amidotransferase subunit B
MAAGGKSPKQIVEDKGLAQVSDTGAIDTEIDRVLADHPDEVARYKDGEAKLLGFFVGQIMKATRGKANPKLVNERLKSKLDT